MLQGRIGPVLVLPSGVMGLDAGDGSRAWSYSRPEIEDIPSSSYTDGFDVGVTPGGEHAVLVWRGDDESDEDFEVATVDLRTGEFTESTRLDHPSHVPTRSEIQGLNPARIPGHMLALDDGVVVSTCQDGCSAKQEDADDNGVFFVPWNGDSADLVTEMPVAEDRSRSQARTLLPVPGGVVVYERGPEDDFSIGQLALLR